MFFRLSSKSGAYYDAATVIPDSIAKEIPKDLTLAYWDYYSESAEFYEAMLKKHTALNRSTVFFGGIWTWNGVAINYDKTFRTTRPALEACKKTGIREVYATLWGDDGGETDVHSALLGMQLYAEYIYTDAVDDARLRTMLRTCCGYSADTFLLLDIDNVPGSENYKNNSPAVENTIMASKQLLYQDVLEGLFDKSYSGFDFKGHYSRILSRLDKAEIPEDLRPLFDYHRQLVVTLIKKCNIGMLISDNYRKNNTDGLEKNVGELKALCADFEALLEKRSRLWLLNNKAFGLDRLDLRTGGLIMRIKRAEKRLTAYLNNEITSIEELDEPRLSYSLPYSKCEFIHCQYTDKFNTVSV